MTRPVPAPASGCHPQGAPLPDTPPDRTSSNYRASQPPGLRARLAATLPSDTLPNAHIVIKIGYANERLRREWW